MELKQISYVNISYMKCYVKISYMNISIPHKDFISEIVHI